jgi:hypothetical protein
VEERYRYIWIKRNQARYGVCVGGVRIWGVCRSVRQASGRRIWVRAVGGPCHGIPNELTWPRKHSS